MTRFITPGDIMRQTMATLRHRGFDVDRFQAKPLDGLIVGSGLAVRAFDQHIATVVYNEQTGIARVFSPGFDLDYTYEAEES